VVSTVSTWATAFSAIIVTGLAALFGAAVRRPSRPCLTCAGLGLTRGERGRWGRICGRCRGGGQLDTWAARTLVALSRGRWAPPGGTVARGRQHAQGYRLAGRHPGGRWRAAPDPDDTRLAALREVRVPAAQRLLDRRQSAHEAAHGLVKVWTWARVAAARRGLHRATEAAEAHAVALADNAGGYRGRRRNSH